MYAFTYLLFVKFVISFVSSADMLEQCGYFCQFSVNAWYHWYRAIMYK